MKLEELKPTLAYFRAVSRSERPRAFGLMNLEEVERSAIELEVLWSASNALELIEQNTLGRLCLHLTLLVRAWKQGNSGDRGALERVTPGFGAVCFELLEATQETLNDHRSGPLVYNQPDPEPGATP